MTNLGLPPQGAALSAHAAVAAGLERSGGKHQGVHDGSTFDALLGAFDDGNAPAHGATTSGGATAQTPTTADETTPTIPVPTSISLVHSLGSGVLVAVDTPSSAVKASRESGRSAKTSDAETTGDTDADASADASTLTNLGWAALIMNATGVAPVSAAPAAGDDGASHPATASTAEPVAPGAKPATSKAANDGPLGTTAGNGKIQVQTPAGVAVTNSLQPIALSAGAAPVDVKVARSITYLGLDPVARDPKLQTTGAAALHTNAAAPRAAAAPQTTTSGALQPSAAPASGGGSSTMSGDGQPGQAMRNPGKNGPASSSPAAPKETTAAASGAIAASDNSGVSQIAVGAISPGAVPTIGLAQLGDVIATAAQSLGTQDDGLTPAAMTTTAGANLASASPVKELDVQLNPASLGALSIEMRLSQGNLSVTIKADKSDTVKLIENERSSISEKLKSLNFSVETLSVKTMDATPGVTSSNDAANSGTTGYGEARQGQSGQSADGSSSNGRPAQGESGRNRPETPQRGILGETREDRDLGHRFL
jgi:flagellar hook-length control protein FliK